MSKPSKRPSLGPLKFDEAVADLLEVKPPEKYKAGEKHKASTSRGRSIS